MEFSRYFSYTAPFIFLLINVKEDFYNYVVYNTAVMFIFIIIT